MFMESVTTKQAREALLGGRHAPQPTQQKKINNMKKENKNPPSSRKEMTTVSSGVPQPQALYSPSGRQASQMTCGGGGEEEAVRATWCVCARVLHGWWWWWWCVCVCVCVCV